MDLLARYRRIMCERARRKPSQQALKVLLAIDTRWQENEAASCDRDCAKEGESKFCCAAAIICHVASFYQSQQSASGPLNSAAENPFATRSTEESPLPLASP